MKDISSGQLMSLFLTVEEEEEIFCDQTIVLSYSEWPVIKSYEYVYIFIFRIGYSTIMSLKSSANMEQNVIENKGALYLQ